MPQHAATLGPECKFERECTGLIDETNPKAHYFELWSVPDGYVNGTVYVEHIAGCDMVMLVESFGEKPVEKELPSSNKIAVSGGKLQRLRVACEGSGTCQGRYQLCISEVVVLV